MTKRAQCFFAVLTAVLLGAVAFFLWQSGFFSALTSSAQLEAYIDRFSPFGQCVFFLLQLMSVVLAPIPSNITALAGAVLFGLWQSFFLTYAAVILGSILVFALARVLGHSFVDQIVSRKLSDKYLDMIQAKQDVFLLLVFLLPFFPDDLICILAGLTKIRPLRFLVIALVARPWGLLVSSAVGSAAVSIPIWGMVLLGIAGVAVFLVGLKYGDVWEQKLLNRFKRK